MRITKETAVSNRSIQKQSFVPRDSTNVQSCSNPSLINMIHLCSSHGYSIFSLLPKRGIYILHFNSENTSIFATLL
jgi:hypothetical protein